MTREQLPIPGTTENPAAEALSGVTLGPVFRSEDDTVTLYHGNCLEILERLPAESVDVVFADPPYFLSGGGSTCRGGSRVKVDKGAWDKPSTVAGMHAFNRAWLLACRRAMKPNGAIWVSGTTHNILSVGFAMQELGFKMLNDIVWEKPNPPPNLSCRYFTHSTETLLWAARDKKSRHFFAYDAMRAENGGKQMKSVWRFPPPGKSECEHGRYPTQKPEALVSRALRASLPPGGTVLDPFMGSGTTGVVARQLGARFIGIDQATEAIETAKKRIIGVGPAVGEATVSAIQATVTETVERLEGGLPESELQPVASMTGGLILGRQTFEPKHGTAARWDVCDCSACSRAKAADSLPGPQNGGRPKADEQHTIDRLDRSKPPPGYLVWFDDEWACVCWGLEDDGQALNHPDDGLTEETAIAAAWTHFEERNDPPGMRSGRRGGLDEGFDVLVPGIIKPGAGGFSSATAARAAAWAWYWDAVALFNEMEGENGPAETRQGAWPQQLTWTADQRAAVRRWLSEGGELPEVLR